MTEDRSQGERVFATVSWIKLAIAAGGPFVLLAIGYIFFSERSAAEIFSQENLTQATVWRPRPEIWIPAVIIFVGMIVYKVVGFIRSKGKYLWTLDGVLILGTRKLESLRSLDADDVTLIQGSVQAYLVIGRKNREPRTVMMTLANFDDDRLVGDISSAIREAMAAHRNSGNSKDTIPG